MWTRGHPAFLGCRKGSGRVGSLKVWQGRSWPLQLPCSFLIGAHSYCPFIIEGRAHPSQLSGSHAGLNLSSCLVKSGCSSDWGESRGPESHGIMWVTQSLPPRGWALSGWASQDVDWGLFSQGQPREGRHGAPLEVSSFWLSPGTFGAGKERKYSGMTDPCAIHPFSCSSTNV